MRQVTGRSSNNSTNKASIRLASGGRFFSATNLGDVAENGDILVVVDTPRVTLVTPQIASELSAEDIKWIETVFPAEQLQGMGMRNFIFRDGRMEM